MGRACTYNSDAGQANGGRRTYVRRPGCGRRKICWGDEYRRTPMTYFSSTLIAVDGSLASDDALNVACSIAKDRGGKLTACGVVEPQLRLIGRHVEEAPDSDAQREIFAALRIAAERARAQYGLSIDTTLAHGDPVPGGGPAGGGRHHRYGNARPNRPRSRSGRQRGRGGLKAQHGPGAIGPSLTEPAWLGARGIGTVSQRVCDGQRSFAARRKRSARDGAKPTAH
jgi:hypothetical protein